MKTATKKTRTIAENLLAASVGDSTERPSTKRPVGALIVIGEAENRSANFLKAPEGLTTKAVSAEQHDWLIGSTNHRKALSRSRISEISCSSKRSRRWEKIGRGSVEPLGMTG